MLRIWRKICFWRMVSMSSVKRPRSCTSRNAPRRSVVTSYSLVRATVSCDGGGRAILVLGLYPSAEADANSRHILVPVGPGAELLGLEDRRAQDELRLAPGVRP